ncbi:MAG TPA: hemolysin family protein [Anaerolineales bacterium]
MNNLWLSALALLVLFILDGLLAMARAALVNSRGSKLQSMVEEQVPGAALAQRLASEATRFLLSLRIGLGGIRLLSVGLGLALYVGLLAARGSEGSLPGLALAVVGAGGLIGLTEFIAENLALRDPERWANRLGVLVAVVVSLLSPFGRLLLWLSGRISGGQNGRRHPLVTEEEIMTMVDAGEEGGAIEQDAKDMIYSIFQLDDTLAREVMIPRIDVLAFEEHTSLEEATDGLLGSGYSRAPVYRGSIDNVVGLVYVKDLLAAWREGGEDKAVGKLMREPYFVPEAKLVDDLLEEMQDRRVQMAIVVDEYGGTAGVVTIEDIVEEIIGEIRDEYDQAEQLRFEQVREGEFIFSGGIDLDDVNDITGAELPKETSDTLGGFIYSRLGRVPSPGDRLVAGGLELVVDQVVRRRIRSVRASLLPPALEGAPGSASGQEASAPDPAGQTRGT